MSVHDIPFQLSTIAEKEIGDHLIIDFHASYGFILKTNNEMLAFGLQIQKE